MAMEIEIHYGYLVKVLFYSLMILLNFDFVVVDFLNNLVNLYRDLWCCCYLKLILKFKQKKRKKQTTTSEEVVI
jgi:hypothetical protein